MLITHDSTIIVSCKHGVLEDGDQNNKGSGTNRNSFNPHVNSETEVVSSTYFTVGKR